MITLTLAGTTLELSDRLLWVDEFQWSPVATELRWGTTGAPQIHVGLRQAGRPITLDGRESQAWITRELCDQLNAWGKKIALQAIHLVQPHVGLGQLVDLDVEVAVDLLQLFLVVGQLAQHAIECRGQPLEFIARIEFGPQRQIAMAEIGRASCRGRL